MVDFPIPRRQPGPNDGKERETRIDKKAMLNAVAPGSVCRRMNIAPEDGKCGRCGPGVGTKLGKRKARCGSARLARGLALHRCQRLACPARAKSRWACAMVQWCSGAAGGWMEHVCRCDEMQPREAWSAELSLFLCRPQQPTGPPLSRPPSGAAGRSPRSSANRRPVGDHAAGQGLTASKLFRPAFPLSVTTARLLSQNCLRDGGGPATTHALVLNTSAFVPSRGAQAASQVGSRSWVHLHRHHRMPRRVVAMTQRPAGLPLAFRVLPLGRYLVVPTSTHCRQTLPEIATITAQDPVEIVAASRRVHTSESKPTGSLPPLDAHARTAISF